MAKKTRQARSARRPSIRSVSGSHKTFTVINYNDKEDEDEVDNGTRPHSPHDVPEVRFYLDRSQPGSPTSDISVFREDSLRSQSPNSILQRSLSIQDEQELRSALKNTDLLNGGDMYHGPTDIEIGIAESNDASNAVYKTQTKSLDILEVARRGKLFGKSKQRKSRLVHKNGDCNVTHVRMDSKGRSYLIDLFTTLLELPWRYTLTICILVFLTSWIFFALIWWGLAVRPIVESQKPCIDGVYNFVTGLLFSIETQQTIGYGTRAVTEECPAAIVLMMVQSLVGVVIQCVITGLIFAKLARPQRRGETIMFSKNAVISKHNHHLCIMFRIADMRKSHMICVTINAILVKQKNKNMTRTYKRVLTTQYSNDDEQHVVKQCKLDLYAESDNFYFLAWPALVVHQIDENSPLWEMSPEELLSEDFEIIVVLEGINETTGMTTQVKTSYLPSEIMWGHKLAALLSYQKANGQYKIDYTKFHSVIPTDTMEMSAKDMKAIRARRQSTRSVHSVTKSFHPQFSTVNETEEG